jgi:predicted branched-subunit amino acid permease
MKARHRKIVGDGIGVGVATGAYGLSFGAISIASHLNLAQTCALSLLMFSGASQFALVGVVASGGNPLAGAASAVLLGARNAFYGLRLAPMLGLRGPKRAVVAQLVIDESTAMALAQTGRGAERDQGDEGDEDGDGRVGFFATGLSVFVLWNLGTLLGAVAARHLTDPKQLGLDAAVPAAFLALLSPRMKGRQPWAIALTAAAVALALSPFAPAGVPVLAAAAVAVVAGVAGR